MNFVKENKPSEGVALVPLITDVLNDVQLLFRQELTLAKKEVSQEISKLKSSMLLLGISLIFAMMGILLTGFTLVYAVSTFYPNLELWKIFAVVSVLSIVISSIFVMKGLRVSKSINILPGKTLESIKESGNLVKEAF